MHCQRWVIPCAVLLALTACDHSAPFSTQASGTSAPHAPGDPARLTFSAAADRDAAWLPDGSGFAYSGARGDVGNVRCLMLLPATGGRATSSHCPGTGDTFNEFYAPALTAAGRVALVRMKRLAGAPFPNLVELAVGALDSLPVAQGVLSVPFSFNGQVVNQVTQLHWLADGSIAFRGGFEGNVCEVNSPCGPGLLIYLDSGLGLFVQPADSAAGGPQLIPGTALASSLTVAPDGDALYYTLNGDSHVYRRIMSSGAVTSVADIPGTIVRDVQVGGSWLVALVDGNPQVFVADGVGPVQWDLGGDLVVMDMVSGTVYQLSSGAHYRHPSLSADGLSLVAEQDGDLWLFDLR